MVQARPNRARLSGTVERIAITADCPDGWSEVQLRVAECDDVDAIANMLHSTVGTVVDVLVACDDVARAAVAVHDEVAIEVRRVSPQRIVGDGSTLERITT